MLEYIGWIATAIFACSYFFKNPAALRALQALSALLWISYGVIIHANPVIVSNLIVAVMAVLTVWLERRRKTEPAVRTEKGTSPEKGVRLPIEA